MQTLSLVGLKATDVAATLARDGTFSITSYRDPIAIVIPARYANKRELIATFERIANEIFNGEE